MTIALLLAPRSWLCRTSSQGGWARCWNWLKNKFLWELPTFHDSSGASSWAPPTSVTCLPLSAQRPSPQFLCIPCKMVSPWYGLSHVECINNLTGEWGKGRWEGEGRKPKWGVQKFMDNAHYEKDYTWVSIVFVSAKHIRMIRVF